jgi:L-fuconolactonase
MHLADSHAHLFTAGIRGRYGRACSGGDDLEVYESFRRQHQIDMTLLVGYEGDSEYLGNNEHVVRLATANDWIVPLAFTHLDVPQVPSAPFVGVSVYLASPEEAKRFTQWPPEIMRGLNDEEMLVSVNAVPEALAVAGPALRAVDGCRILISHLGEPGTYAAVPSRDDAQSALEPLLALSNAMHVGVKLSGLYAISDPGHAYPHAAARPFVELIAEAFGTDRLYWGSDFSPALDYVSFPQAISAVSDLAWSDAEREAIMGENLRRLVARSSSV